MRFRTLAFLLLGLVACSTAVTWAQETAGKRLAAALDSMDVEHKWLAKNYVKWETGEALDKPVTDGKPHTHCSAFAAATCKKLGIYLLRPPEHAASYLANAQYDWLAAEEGKKSGWHAVKTASDAQRRANDGELVVAVYKEEEPKHGHIAIIRPSTKSERDVAREGPQIIQAGMDNYQSASLKEGFKHHPGAFREQRIRYFAHDVKWE